MTTKTKSNQSWIAGVMAAVAASLCCITPVLAVIGGLGGAASSLSWIEPFRPYLIGATILIFGFAWYQKLKPKTKEEIECACDENEKPKFIQSKTFLGIVTILAAFLIAFPLYAKIFFPKNEKQIIIIDKSNIQTAAFEISGMNCSACEEEVKHEVNKLNGIVKVESSYEKNNAQVQFDNSKSNLDQIVKAINSTGYTVTKSEIKK